MVSIRVLRADTTGDVYVALWGEKIQVTPTKHDLGTS